LFSTIDLNKERNENKNSTVENNGSSSEKNRFQFSNKKMSSEVMKEKLAKMER